MAWLQQHLFYFSVVFSGVIVLAVFFIRQSIVLWLSKKLAAYKTE
jgi:hypothetical protein